MDRSLCKPNRGTERVREGRRGIGNGQKGVSEKTKVALTGQLIDSERAIDPQGNAMKGTKAREGLRLAWRCDTAGFLRERDDRGPSGPIYGCDGRIIGKSLEGREREIARR